MLLRGGLHANCSVESKQGFRGCHACAFYLAVWKTHIVEKMLLLRGTEAMIILFFSSVHVMVWWSVLSYLKGKSTVFEIFRTIFRTKKKHLDFVFHFSLYSERHISKNLAQT